MHLIDRNFRQEKRNYILQCSVATAAVTILLLILDANKDAAIIAALGASSFICFAMPHKQVSRPRFVLGGYIVGVTIGILASLLAQTELIYSLSIVAYNPYAFFGALAVGATMLIMIATDTEHPPAAGLALALVLNDWSFFVLAVILIGATILIIMKSMLKGIMIDLL